MRRMGYFYFAMRSAHVNVFSGCWSVAVRAQYEHVRMVVLETTACLGSNHISAGRRPKVSKEKLRTSI